MAYQPKSYRKFVATTATAAMVASAVAPVVSAASFTDVAPQYKDAIDFLVSTGATKGKTETKFGVYDEITRLDAAVILARVLKLDVDNAKDAGFTDVPKDRAKYVNALVEAGVLNGKAPGKFGAYDPLTRVEMAKIIANRYKLKADDVKLPFTDVNDTWAPYVKALYKYEVTKGKTPTSFGAYQNITRGDFAQFVYRAVNINAVPEIVEVTAVNSTTVKVTFNTQIADVDFTNFAIDNGLTVTKATLSRDKKSVEVVVNKPFTRNQEYTITATGIKNLKGETAKELTGKFVWSVQDAVTVALNNSSLKVGEESGLTVKDQDGKDVVGAKVELTSSNTNIVVVSSGEVSVSAAKVTAVKPGTADVTAKVTLPDGVVLTNTFKVTVTEVPVQVQNQGFTLVDNLSNAPQNTVAFNKAEKVTSMFAGETKTVAMYDTKNGDPETKPVDFKDATVRSLNPIIATAAINGSELLVTANAGQSGKASFEVTFKDNTKRTFTVDVKKDPVLQDIKVDATSVKLSDEAVGGGEVEGVNQKTIKVSAVDQYGKEIKFGTKGKVTVTTNTEGLVIKNVNSDNTIDFDSGNSATDQFVVVATKDKIVNGKVEVKYFKNASDTTPTSTKTITVNVVNVKADATPVGLDIVAPSEIDVNAPNTASTADVDFINFESVEIYTLDSNGNRLKKVTPTATTLVGTNDYVEVNGNVLQFKGNDELTLLTSSSTVNVDVTADGITKRIPVKYINSASVPASATVATSPVTVKLNSSDNDLTFEELIFGVIDPTQLVKDEDINEFIAVSKAAKNDGYLYNKPLVTVKDASGKVIPTGANVYGLNHDATNGNIWFDEEQAGLAKKFSDVHFDVDFSLANVVKTGSGTVSSSPSLSDAIQLTNSGDAVSFTLVIKSIYVKGADKDDNNLLAAPVSVNVTVTK
uniref:SbsB protein n=1 Tax=Geobacillus stearothermophilus TaxID=1422 RepID=Q45664_GEOSE|nr:sbsB [Geobacillus stearothermophilus]